MKYGWRAGETKDANTLIGIVEVLVAKMQLGGQIPSSAARTSGFHVLLLEYRLDHHVAIGKLAEIRCRTDRTQHGSLTFGDVERTGRALVVDLSKTLHRAR